MVDEQVAVAHRAHHVGAALVLGAQARLDDRRVGRVAQLGVAGELGQLPAGRSRSSMPSIG